MQEQSVVQCPHCNRAVEVKLTMTESETSKRLANQRDAARKEVHRLEAMLVDRYRMALHMESQLEMLRTTKDRVAASVETYRSRVDALQKALDTATKPSFIQRIFAFFEGR